MQARNFREPMRQAELELIIETIPDAVVVVDRSGRITFANRAAETILGLSRSEITARTYDAPEWKLTTVDGKPFPQGELPFDLVMRDGRPVYEVELAIERPDGERVILSVNASPVRDGKGNIISVAHSFTDITKRKVTELALQESEQRFRKLLEEIDLVAVIVDVQGKIIFVNKFLLNLTGRTREAVVGGNMFDIFVAKEKREELKRAFIDAVDKGELPARYEYEMVTEEGEHRVISYSNVFLRDAEGNITGVASIGEDVTEQRRAAEEIRESRRQVLDILESITDGFFALDNDWRFTYVNQKAAQLVGRRREELLFRNMWEAIPETVGTKFDEEYHRAVEEKTPVTFEVLYPPLNKWFEVHAYPFENGLSVYVSDITERKRVEEALRESENRYRTLFEDAPVALWEQDASEITARVNELKKQGVTDFRAYFEQYPEAVFEMLATIKIIDVNRATLKLYGASSKEEFIRNFGSTVTKEGLDAAREFFTVYAERGEVKFEAEFTSRTFKGDTLYVRVISFIPPGYEETRSKIFIATLDITERKRVEEALAESETKFRAIFEQATYGIYMGGLDGILVSANKALEDIFGYTKDEINRMGGFFEVAYPDPVERERIRGMAKRSMQAQVSYVEVPMIRKDGRRIWISVSARTVTIRGKDNFVGIVEDITLRKQAEELSDALNRINAAVIASLDADEIMSTVVDESGKVIGSEEAGIILREGNYWVYKYIYGAPEGLLGARLTDDEIKYSMLVVETKQPVVSNDTYHDERFYPDVMRRIGIRSFLAVPLEIHGDVIGIFYNAYRSAAIPFTAAQVDFAAKLGTLTSFALENARLYSIKKDVADTMQETLLTLPAHIEGIEFSHVYRAAPEAARVGGDFYDIFTLKGSKVGIAVGDIAGTGVQAAILASMVKNAFRAYAYENDSPAQVMAKTNELIRGTISPGLFVTAIFGILDTETGQLIYCSAGHPPAILKRKTLEATLLITSSPILGAFPSLNFIDDEEMLEKGDAVVLYTNGVTEARCRDGRLFGEEQLVGLMKSLTALVSIKDIPKIILDAVTECTGGVISDDIVILSFGLANR